MKAADIYAPRHQSKSSSRQQLRGTKIVRAARPVICDLCLLSVLVMDHGVRCRNKEQENGCQRMAWDDGNAGLSRSKESHFNRAEGVAVVLRMLKLLGRSTKRRNSESGYRVWLACIHVGCLAERRNAYLGSLLDLVDDGSDFQPQERKE